MLPYWLLFTFFAIPSIFAREDPRPDKSIRLLVVAWVVLVLMIGLRWEVGPDWQAYEIWWKLAGLRPLDRFLSVAGADPGFYILLWGLRHVGAPFWLLNLTVAAIFAYGLVAFARAQINPWLGITVAVPYLVIVVAMSGIRQATAIGLVFLALVAFRRQQGWKFLIYMFLAASFHASAILVVPFAGLSFTRNRFQAVVLAAIIAIGAFYELSSTFLGYSDRYLSGLGVQSSGTLFRLGMSALPALIYLPFRKRFPASPHEQLLWRNLSIAALASLPIFVYFPSTTALDRLVLYLYPLQIYVLSWFPSVVRGPSARFVTTIAILVYLSLQLFVFLNFATNKDAYLPYRMLPFAD